jgi:hypothetical protein
MVVMAALLSPMGFVFAKRFRNGVGKTEGKFLLLKRLD